MANTIFTRISLRKDNVSNWTTKNPVLADGELAIVVADDGSSENIKLGNGLSAFNQLPYLYQEEVKTDKVTAKEVTAKSISQGYNVKSTPTSLATGIFTEADGNFDVVHGIEAQAKEGDDYAFVFNGTNLPAITDRYQSHGQGTFNINPLSGLAGTYIGDQSLSSILSTYLLSSEISNYYTQAQIEVIYNNLTGKIELSTSNVRNEARNELYSVSSDLQAQDAAIVQQLDLLAEKHDSDTTYLSSQLSNDVKNLADNYWKKTETSSAVEISNAIKNIDLSEYYKKSETSSASQISASLSSISSAFKAQDAAIVAKIVEVSGNLSNSLSNYWKKSETSSSSQLSNEFKKYQLSGNYLLSTDLSFTYDSSKKYIYLKAFNGEIGSVNCADFIKDGMLSSVQLCGNVLIFKFNTDAGTTPISVNLSSFVDNYDAKITYLSNAITADVKNLADNYWKKTETSSASEISSSLSSLSSNLKAQNAAIYQKVAILSDSVDDLSSSLTGYWQKADITLSTDGQLKVGSTQITALTAHQSLDNYYPKTETSSSIQLDTAFSKYQLISDMSKYALTSQIPTKTSQLTNDSGFLTEHQSLTAYETKSDLTTNYYNKTQVDSISSTLSGKIPTKVSQLTNDAGYTTNVGTITGIKMNGSSKGTSGVVDLGTVLTEHQSLTAYYPKTETSSSTQLNTAFSKYQLTSDMSKYELTSDLTANYYKKDVLSTASQISSALASKVMRGSYLSSTGYSLSSADLSIVNIGEEDFYKLVAESADLKDVMYIVSADGMNLHGQKITNVAEPTLSGDVATKNYVDTSLPSVYNGTLTIQRNGTTLTSFSANSSSNVTANIQAVTGITMNGSSKGSSGTVDLGTVLTAHQSLADYATKAFVSAMISSMIDDALTAQYGNVLNEEY